MKRQGSVIRVQGSAFRRACARWMDDMQWRYEHPRAASRNAQRAWNYTMSAMFIITIFWFGAFIATALVSGRVAHVQNPDLPVVESEAR